MREKSQHRGKSDVFLTGALAGGSVRLLFYLTRAFTVLQSGTHLAPANERGHQINVRNIVF